MKKTPQFTIFGHFDSTQLEIVISNQPKSDHNEGHLVKHKRKDHKPKDLTIDLDALVEKKIATPRIMENVGFLAGAKES